MSRIQQKLLSLNNNDLTYQARKECLENDMEKDLNAVDSFEQNLKKGWKKKKISRHRFENR